MAKKTKTVTTDASKAVLYMRVSTEDQNLGLGAQKTACRAWAAANNIEIVAEFEDHGVSGAAALSKCKGLMQALSTIASDRVGLLLVAKMDRLSRDMLKSITIESEVQKLGAKIASAAGEGTESNDPAARMMRGIIQLFSAYEREILIARTCAALAVKKSNGHRTGNVPYGWQVAEDGRTLVAHDAERQTVAYIRGLSNEGMSLRKIGARLDAEGVTLRNITSWKHANQVQRALDANW